MENFLVAVLIITTTTLNSVICYPADHREDTVLPFSLSPGNVNLETYYLDKYPQTGVPGGPLVKKSTSQMTPSPLDPVPIPEAVGKNFFVQNTKDPHAMFRTRREAMSSPPQQFGARHHYPSGGRQQGFGLYDEGTLHLHQYPRHHGGGGAGLYEVEEQQHYRQRDHQSQGTTHHLHQYRPNSPSAKHHPHPHSYHGRY